MLQKWSPFNDMLDTFLFGSYDRPMDTRESEKGFEIEVDLPGVEPADIDIGVSEGKLSIKAERKWAKAGGHAAFHRSFSESFILPSTVDSNEISATYAHGVLRVSLPKRAGPPARKVEVRTG
jgi:HSP20 family protein